MVNEEPGFTQVLLDVLAVFFKNCIVFEKVGGETLDGDWFVGGEFVIDGECANIFFGSGNLAGQIEFGGGDSGRNDGAVGNAFIVFVWRERKEPFFILDAKVAVPTIGKFEGERGFFLVYDILVDK